MVTVKYEGPYSHSFGKSEDKFEAKTLEDVVKKIEEMYEGKGYVDMIRSYSTIFHNDQLVCKVKKDNKYVYDMDTKLRDEDILTFTLLLAGG